MCLQTEIGSSSSFFKILLQTLALFIKDEHHTVKVSLRNAKDLLIISLHTCKTHSNLIQYVFTKATYLEQSSSIGNLYVNFTGSLGNGIIKLWGLRLWCRTAALTLILCKACVIVGIICLPWPVLDANVFCVVCWNEFVTSRCEKKQKKMEMNFKSFASRPQKYNKHNNNLMVVYFCLHP